MNIVLYRIRFFFHHQTQPQLNIVSSLAQPLYSFGAISLLFPSTILDTCWPGGPTFMSYLFAFSYCSWGSCGKNTEVVCHSLLQWTTFCQNSQTWPVHLGWPCPAWFIVPLSYTRLWSMWSFWLVSVMVFFVLEAIGLKFLLLLSALWWMKIRGLCRPH